MGCVRGCQEIFSSRPAWFLGQNACTLRIDEHGGGARLGGSDVELGGAGAVSSRIALLVPSVSPVPPANGDARPPQGGFTVAPGWPGTTERALFGEKHGFVLFKLFERSSGALEASTERSSWWAKDGVVIRTTAGRVCHGGYAKDHWVLALQTFVAYVIVLAIVSPDAVYAALSYGGSFQPVWGIIYLLMLGVLGGDGRDEHAAPAVRRRLAGVCRGAFGLWVRHMTFLAAGSDWGNNDVAKGATYTLLMSVCVRGVQHSPVAGGTSPTRSSSCAASFSSSRRGVTLGRKLGRCTLQVCTGFDFDVGSLELD